MAARFVYTLRQAAKNAPKKLGLGSSSRHAHSSAHSNNTSDANMRRAFMVFIGGIATYTASQQLVRKEGSHLGVSLQRGMNKEETHRLEGASNTATGQADSTAAVGSAAKSPRRLTWWRVAHVKDGAQGSSSASPAADPWGLRGPAAGSLRAGGHVV